MEFWRAKTLLNRSRIALVAICITFFGLVPVFAPEVANADQVCASVFSTSQQRDLLTSEAAKFNLKVSTYKELFRYDSRSPKEIRSTNGFQPNPAKPSGDLQEHVRSRSTGTNRFVSLSFDADNTALFLQDAFLTESGRSKKFPTKKSKEAYLKLFAPENLARLEKEPELIDARLSEILGQPFDNVWFDDLRSPVYKALSPELKAEFDELIKRRQKANSQLYNLEKGFQAPQVLEFNQYRTKDVRGIETSSIGIAREKEVVAEKVDANHITHYRKVYLVIYGGGVEIGSPTDPHYAMELSFALHLSGMAPEVVFGQWRKF